MLVETYQKMQQITYRMLQGTAIYFLLIVYDALFTTFLQLVGYIK